MSKSNICFNVIILIEKLNLRFEGGKNGAKYSLKKESSSISKKILC